MVAAVEEEDGAWAGSPEEPAAAARQDQVPMRHEVGMGVGDSLVDRAEEVVHRTQILREEGGYQRDS